MARIRAVAAAAQRAGRDVVIIGRSIRRAVDVATELGYLDGLPPFLDQDAYGYLPRNRVVALMTGSQGEPRAALSRIAAGDHREVALSQGDRVIFSSRTIPGNERAVNSIINTLVDFGAEVITDRDALVHTSGHPRREEIRQLYDWTKPQIVVPVHGEALHLHEQAKIARAAGIPQVLEVRNGNMVRLAPGRAERLDSEVLPEYREFERMSTTVLTAYVGPVMDRYVSRLGASVSRLRLMASDGGSITPESAVARAAQTLLSGPAGGVTAAQALGFGKVISFDMGGTSTDVALIDGRARVTKEGEIGGLPLRVPHFEIHTVGAGGGSIARFDAGGALRVGPESAGSTPGPVCYGRGGTVPTVTDANLALGRIDPDRFFGGRMRLTRPGLSRRLAEGILEVANANMERALRRVSVERGSDPADFRLLAFGGAGPLHACEMAARLGMKGVIVPRWPGLLSALGMVLADLSVEKSRTVLGRTADFGPLEREARRELDGRVERFVEARYRGQSHELRIPEGASFHEAHRRRFGYAREAPVEVVNLVVRVTAPLPKPRLPRIRRGSGRVFTGAVDRDALGAGDRVRGPAVVSEGSATTWIPRGWAGRVDPQGHIEISQY
ncbi:MAG TPA: hydantoinase/oxoprolinase family protein [Planctomycetota bacterium]|nr:hydantoinase/oxoprolinase family protein [Planctomycetota bacterium]